MYLGMSTMPLVKNMFLPLEGFRIKMKDVSLLFSMGSEIRLTQNFVDFSRWNPSHSPWKGRAAYKILLEGQITTMLNSYDVSTNETATTIASSPDGMYNTYTSITYIMKIKILKWVLLTL